ncbi:MAG: hypothetical protein HYY52_02550 [Candidatus Melainabacteria bacterium]|nr:hypothetical protein [Candidatus Melainabacteria bacterium]
MVILVSDALNPSKGLYFHSSYSHGADSDFSSEWRVAKWRVGFLGRFRDYRYRQYDEKYGKGNWQIAWQLGRKIVPFETAAFVYGEAYYKYMLVHPEIVNYLTTNARDVYDNSKSNVDSGTDYKIQESNSNHLQDISIRRAIARMGLTFKGEKLIQVRGKSKDQVGKSLQPGKTPFHKPELIAQHIDGWWEKDSIEDFYQGNKILIAKL